jgi:hypothetical protein
MKFIPSLKRGMYRTEFNTTTQVKNIAAMIKTAIVTFFGIFVVNLKFCFFFSVLVIRKIF